MAAHELYTVEGGKLRVTLHPGQTKAWDSPARYVFVIAGTQSGKTSFGPPYLYREIQRCGPGDYLAATATYDLFKLKMLPEMRRWFEDVTGWGSYSASERVIYSKDEKSRIILRSADAEGGLESMTALAAWIDECGQPRFRLDAWEAVQRRLSLSEGRVLGTTTPYNLGWLKTEVYDRWKAGDKDFEVIQFKSIMNPAFPMAEYRRMKAKMPRWKFKMFYNGDFTRPAGLIYEDFTEDLIVDDQSLPATWPRYVGIDFGAVNTATIWAARDIEHDVYYLYRESLEGGMATAGHVAKARERARGENVVSWFGGAKSETQQRMDWKAAGLTVMEPAVSDVESGIDRVVGLLKQKRLYVFRSLRGLADELNTYSREVDQAGQPTEKIQDKETFHRLDALRYLCIGLTMPAPRPSRFI